MGFYFPADLFYNNKFWGHIAVTPSLKCNPRILSFFVTSVHKWIICNTFSWLIGAQVFLSVRRLTTLDVCLWLKTTQTCSTTIRPTVRLRPRCHSHCLRASSSFPILSCLNPSCSATCFSLKGHWSDSNQLRILRFGAFQDVRIRTRNLKLGPAAW